jgi:tetratricopeptide (TPR) repeat protein
MDNPGLRSTLEGRMGPNMAELSDKAYAQIKRLCADGDHFASVGEYSEALSRYSAAWELLPEPRTEWTAATWILAASGDVNYLSGDFEAGRDNLTAAMHCPDAIGNPFLHLRLGQCQFELGNLDRAADELARAFLVEGKQIFEDSDPKYLDFVQSKLTPPQGGWPDTS